MKQFIPYEKMSKKQKRALDRKRRGTWEISPVTRVAQADKKHYSRKLKHKNGTLGGAYSVPDSFCLCGTDKFRSCAFIRFPPA